LIKTNVSAVVFTEETRAHILTLFPHAEFAGLDSLDCKACGIVIFELEKDACINGLRTLLESGSYFLFISDSAHDKILLELSREYFFMFTLKTDPVNEIVIRFNTLTKYRDIKQELETKTEELETTIFELAFASTNVLEQNEFLEQMAKKDGLTLLYNHSYFKDKLKHEIIRSERYHNHFTVALFDLDFFKKVNDHYGHVKGDEVLKVFANIIKDSVRTSDIAARYGGEEFAVLFTETDLESSISVVDRIREKLSETVFSSEADCFKVTFSSGVTPYHKGIRDAEQMVNIADKALYMSKANGRNRTTILTAEDVN
jgi:diguanylate cyclase (GGDEF)-like protein